MKQRGAIADRFALKNGKSTHGIFINKQNKKQLKRIKQSSIKKHNNIHSNINFANKVVSSVKNPGTSRVSYNQIFYTNKPKSSLKNYNNALKSYIPKKKSSGRETNSSAQLTYIVKNRKDLSTTSRHLTSDKKMHQTETSPCNNKSQCDFKGKTVGKMKNKLIKTISNHQILKRKRSTKKVKKPKCDDSEYLNMNNVSYGINYDSTDSNTSSDFEKNKLKLFSGKKNLAKVLKKTNESLFLAAENGSLAIIQNLLGENQKNFRPDINFRGPDFKTPLYAATSEGHFEVVEFLISEGAIADTKTICERNPFHIACLRGHTSIIKLLFKAEPALLNSLDIYGNTPTHYASKYGN